MHRREHRAGSQRIWAAVPFRGPSGAKRRLAGLLSKSERERLTLAMLTDVLDVLLVTPSIERVLLLTPSPTARVWPGHERLTVLEEPLEAAGAGGTDGLNRAVRHAQAVADVGGADALLVLPADLPLVELADVEAVLKAGASASVVIAPDRAGEGTNALLLTPPTALDPGFGDGSYQCHLDQAANAALHVTVVERDGIALDLDTPDDVALLMTAGHAGRAAMLLGELQVDRRLRDFVAGQARSTTI